MYFKPTEIFLSMSENSVFKISKYQHMRGVFKDDRFVYTVLVMKKT